jgi:hypothetical protein
MVTRSQIGRLAQRIDALATRVGPPTPMVVERWIVERAKAWRLENPEAVISAAELAARRTAGARILSHIVHAKNGRLAECCQPGGSCRIEFERFQDT